MQTRWRRHTHSIFKIGLEKSKWGKTNYVLCFASIQNNFQPKGQYIILSSKEKKYLLKQKRVQFCKVEGTLYVQCQLRRAGRRVCQPPAEHFWWWWWFVLHTSLHQMILQATHASLSPKQESLLPVVICTQYLYYYQYYTIYLPVVVDVLGGGLKFPPGKRLRLQIVAVDSVESQHPVQRAE